MRRKKQGWEAIGFTPNLIREEVEEENRKARKEAAEQEIRDLQKQKLEKEIELLNDRNKTSEPPVQVLSNKKIDTELNTLLTWEVFTLDMDTGAAMLAGKYHQFNINKPPYKCYLTLLRKRIESKEDGEVTYEELFQATGFDNKEKIKQVIRHLRKNLEINRTKNPNNDFFHNTGKGYKLIIPLKA